MITLCVCLNLTFILYNEIYVILYKSAYILVCLDRSVLLQCACAYINSEHPLVLGCDWMICKVLWRMHYLLLPGYSAICNILLTHYILLLLTNKTNEVMIYICYRLDVTLLNKIINTNAIM